MSVHVVAGTLGLYFGLVFPRILVGLPVLKKQILHRKGLIIGSNTQQEKEMNKMQRAQSYQWRELNLYQQVCTLKVLPLHRIGIPLNCCQTMPEDGHTHSLSSHSLLHYLPTLSHTNKHAGQRFSQVQHNTAPQQCPKQSDQLNANDCFRRY